MIISPLINDVSKKREFWQQFAKNRQCDFKFKQTPHKEVNILKLMCFYKNINISFYESDAKPLICEFKIKNIERITIEIGKLTMFDKLSTIFKKNKKLYNHPFFNKNKIKTNNVKILNSFLNDDSLISLMNNSEFFGLYAYAKDGFLNVRITSSYFVNSYKKLTDICFIVCKIVDYLTENVKSEIHL